MIPFIVSFSRAARERDSSVKAGVYGKMILYPEPDLVFPSIRKLSKELQVFPLAFDESVFGKALYGFGKIDITLFELKRLKVTAFLYEKAGEEGCVIVFLR